jgi:hypothetical protein
VRGGSGPTSRSERAELGHAVFYEDEPGIESGGRQEVVDKITAKEAEVKP